MILVSAILLILVLPSLPYDGSISERNESHHNIIMKSARAELADSESSRMGDDQPSSTNESNLVNELCRADKNGFIINYSKSWYKFPRQCLLFSPEFDVFSDKNLQSYVRISVANVSAQNLSLVDVANIVSLADPNFFQQIHGPDFRIELGGHDAFWMLYDWNISDKSALPFVNQFAIFSPPTSFAFVEESNLPASTTPSNDTTPVSPSNDTTPVSPSNETTPGSLDGLVRLLAIYAIADDKVYVIEYGSPVDSFDTHLSEVRTMIESFAFTDRASNAWGASKPV